jgi:hypothetical protein
MENLEKIKRDPAKFLSMTSLTVNEFDLLLDNFESYCTEYFYHHTLNGKVRIKIVHKEQKNTSLKGSEMKLFFLISYLKNYPLQQYQASCFNITQAKVSTYVKVLMPLLDKTLQSMELVPTSCPEELKAQLVNYGVEQVNMDVTERDINRSVDDEVQREFYSGKKNDIPLRIISLQNLVNT